MDLKIERVKKAKSVLWEAEKMADKGKEISRLWITDWKKKSQKTQKEPFEERQQVLKEYLPEITWARILKLPGKYINMKTLYGRMLSA